MVDTSKKFLLCDHSIKRFREKFPEMAQLSEAKIYARCFALFCGGVYIVKQYPADSLILVEDRFTKVVFVCTEAPGSITLKTILDYDHARANILARASILTKVDILTRPSGILTRHGRGRGARQRRRKAKNKEARAGSRDHEGDPKRKVRYKREKGRKRDDVDWQ